MGLLSFLKKIFIKKISDDSKPDVAVKKEITAKHKQVQPIDFSVKTESVADVLTTLILLDDDIID